MHSSIFQRLVAVSLLCLLQLTLLPQARASACGQAQFEGCCCVGEVEPNASVPLGDVGAVEDVAAEFGCCSSDSEPVPTEVPEVPCRCRMDSAPSTLPTIAVERSTAVSKHALERALLTPTLPGAKHASHWVERDCGQARGRPPALLVTRRLRI